MIALPALSDLAPWIVAAVLGVALASVLLVNLPKTIETLDAARSAERKRRADLRKVVDELVADRLADRDAILELTLELHRTQADLRTIVNFMSARASAQTREAWAALLPLLQTVKPNGTGHM